MLPLGLTTRRCVETALFLLAIALPIASHASGSGGGSELFMSSAHVNSDNTVTLPLHHGRVGNHDVWFIILDTSSGELSSQLGVNKSQKLANARGSRAVQKVRMDHDDVIFKASVNFCPQRIVVPGPHGFPPAQAEPGAIAYDGYSPLMELPDGTIVNAPHIANWTGMADKVTHLDTEHRRVTYELTEGRQNNRIVHYASTDASDPVAAALENVTFAPLLNDAPTVGGDGTDQARASLGAFVNGQTGAGNPQRQGLNSALLDGLSPLNILAWNPKQGRYSPLWDVHFAAWTDKAMRQGKNTRQGVFFKLENLEDKGFVTGPDGARFGANGIIVDCPLVNADGQDDVIQSVETTSWTAVKDMYRK